jgi:hypothetical protein
MLLGKLELFILLSFGNTNGCEYKRINIDTYKNISYTKVCKRQWGNQETVNRRRIDNAMGKR